MPIEPRRQLRLVALVLAVVVAMLALAYYAVFRTPMVPAYQNIRQNDASAIVAQLDKSGIAYRLENDGHDVLVPEDRAAEARVAVAGANLAMGGTVGFELFNDSDMGLTEFAQKINFQRALQGELARTIMMTQGVEFARVHLAFPERSIFRASQGAPTAAVTVQMMPAHTLTRRRVDGIRQLVASSVPGLTQAAVAVLDERGDLVSPVATTEGLYGGPLDGRAALDAYYQARVREAIAGLEPGLRFDVTVNTQPRAPDLDMTAAPDARALPGRDTLMMTVVVRTETALEPGVQARLDAAVADALALRRDAGDTLRFATGALRTDVVPDRAPMVPAPRLPDEAAPSPIAETTVGRSGPDWGLWAAIAGLIAFALLLVRPRRRLDQAETLSFAEQLKLAAEKRGTGDAG